MKNKLRINFDKEADVLYINFGEPSKADNSKEEKGIIGFNSVFSASSRIRALAKSKRNSAWAGPGRVELPLAVLETAVLPLNYGPKFSFLFYHYL